MVERKYSNASRTQTALGKNPRKTGYFSKILGKGPPMGQRHPLRNQFSGFYEGRADLSGTPDYGNDWLKLGPQGRRFQGLKTDETRKKKGGGGGGQQGGSAAPIMLNMMTTTNNITNDQSTHNNYMGGRGFDDDSEPNWGTPGSEFVDAEPIESMDHDLFNVRERGGGNWDPSGGLPSGQRAIGPGDDQTALGI